MIYKNLTDAAIRHFKISRSRIEKCFNEISNEQLWNDFNDNLVSIGNLVLHLNGNLTQYVISGLAGEEFYRERDKEFKDKPRLSKSELLNLFRVITEKCCEIFEDLSEEKIKKSYIVQGFNYNGAEIIMHVTEHLSYHVGQITFAVKLLNNKDLGYYKGIDLNKQNKR